MGEGTARIQPYLAAKLGQSNDITPAARQGYSSTSRDTHARTLTGTWGHCKLLLTTAQQRSATKLQASGLINAAHDKCWQPICICSVIAEQDIEIYRSIMKREMMVACGGWRLDIKGISVRLLSRETAAFTHAGIVI